MKAGVASPWPWKAPQMRGTLTASRLLLGGGRSWAARTRGALGRFGRAACPWHWAAVFPAAVMPAAILALLWFLGLLRAGAQWSPGPPLTRDARRTPSRAAHPRAPLTFLISAQLRPRAGLLLLLVRLVSWGVLETEFPEDWDAISHLALAVGAREERRRRCDMKVKAAVLAHLARASYYILHLHFAAAISEGKAAADLPGIKRDNSHTFKDVKQILIYGACTEKRNYSGHHMSPRCCGKCKAGPGW